MFLVPKSLLFFNDEARKKKDTDSSFDITMGSFDGAELCELIGIYIQSLLADPIELITIEKHWIIWRRWTYTCLQHQQSTNRQITKKNN